MLAKKKLAQTGSNQIKPTVSNFAEFPPTAFDFYASFQVWFGFFLLSFLFVFIWFDFISKLEQKSQFSYILFSISQLHNKISVDFLGLSPNNLVIPKTEQIKKITKNPPKKTNLTAHHCQTWTAQEANLWKGQQIKHMVPF